MLIYCMLCRHAMLVDQKSESVVVPLNTELGSSGKLELANSTCFYSIHGVSRLILSYLGSLSELAVLGVSLAAFDLMHSMFLKWDHA
jgi:hypothetical protein